MFLEILLAIVLGVASGVFTGLIPGLHVNLITVIVVGFAGMASGVSPFFIALFIISMALTHSFLDSIPSIYLGAPDESQVIGALPGHLLVQQGRGHDAVVYTLVGSLGSLFLVILLAPIAMLHLDSVAQLISPYLGKIIAGIMLLLILFSKKLRNLFFFLASGLLGFLVFNAPTDQTLLPLLTGLFGVSTLLWSLQGESVMPLQRWKKKIPLELSDVEQTITRSTIFGMFASFFPGLGSSQAAIIASATMKTKTPRRYLLLVGGINTVNFSFSLVTLYLLGKARNGAIVGVKGLLDVTLSHLLIFGCVLLIVGGLATLLGLFLSKKMARLMGRVSYSLMVWSVIVFLIGMVIMFSGFIGVIILCAATGLGILATKFGAQKNMLLGCLLLPVITYLW